MTPINYLPLQRECGTLLWITPNVRALTPFFYWLSSKGAKSANLSQ